MATYNREVKEKLGETNYNNILRAVREYKIDSVKMTQFAQHLANFHEGSNIFGAHMRRKARGGECDEYEMRELLSEYYREGMCYFQREQAVSILRLLIQDILKVPDVFKPETPDIKDSLVSQASKMPRSSKEQRCSNQPDKEGILKTDDDSCLSESSRGTQIPRKKVFTKRRIGRKNRRSNLFRIHGATTTDTEEFYLSSSSVLTDVIVSPDGTRQFKFDFKGTPRSSGETITVDGRNQSGRKASNHEGVQQQSSMRPGQRELQEEAQPKNGPPENTIETMFKPWKSERTVPAKTNRQTRRQPTGKQRTKP